MNIYKYLIGIISIAVLTCSSSTSNDNDSINNENNSEENLSSDYSFESLMDAAPKISPNDQIIHHTAYILNYLEEYEQAEWVLYKLTKEHLQGSQERTDDFRADPLVLTRLIHKFFLFSQSRKDAK